MSQKLLVPAIIFVVALLSVLGFLATFSDYLAFFTNKDSFVALVKKQTSQTFILKSDVSGYGMRIEDFKTLEEAAKEIGIFSANAVQLPTVDNADGQTITVKQIQIMLVTEPEKFTSARLDKDKNKTSTVQVFANPKEGALIIRVWLSEGVLANDTLFENLNKYVLFGMYYGVKNRTESLDQIEARVKQKYLDLIENNTYPLVVIEKK